jgi:hypothetical protein
MGIVRLRRTLRQLAQRQLESENQPRS